MTRAFWRLPGPSAFLHEAAWGLARGGATAFALPEGRTDQIEDAIETSFQTARLGHFVFRRVKAERGRTPAVVLVEGLLEPDERPVELSADALAAVPALDACAIWINSIEACDWERWEIFLGAFLAARSRSRLIDPPLIALRLPRGVRPIDSRIATVEFRGVTGRDDMRLLFFEAARGRPKSALDIMLAAELAVESCGWDASLVSVMAGLKLETLLDPFSWAVERAAALGIGPEADWEAGTLDDFEGRPFPSLLCLAAAGQKKTIWTRTWRAQVRAVFPWLEELRQEAVDRWRGRFKLPLRSYDGMKIEDPEDLDWGGVVHCLLGRAPQVELDFFALLKRIRNSIAHRLPAAFNELVEAERLSRKWVSNNRRR